MAAAVTEHVELGTSVLVAGIGRCAERVRVLSVRGRTNVEIVDGLVSEYLVNGDRDRESAEFSNRGLTTRRTRVCNLLRSFVGL